MTVLCTRCQKPMKYMTKALGSPYHGECWRAKLLSDYQKAVYDGNLSKAAVIKEMGQRMKQQELRDGR